MNKRVKQELKKLLNYFVFFNYVPTLKEVWLFYPKKLNLEKLTEMIKKNKLIIEKNRVFEKNQRLLLHETLKRKKISQTKISKRQEFIKRLGKLPWVQFIGISGTVSMLNADVKDDLDLFIITKNKRLWTARFWLVAITSLLGVRRKPHDQSFQDKLCLNLLFSEANLKIPSNKQNQYIGHEILQLLPVVNKNQAYEKLLKVNKWVGELFPNSEKKVKSYKLKFKSTNQSSKVLETIGNRIEGILKRIQLTLIARHKTNEIITDTQLWFFPQDFEKKLAKYL